MLGHRTAREGPEAKDSAHGAGLSFFFFREKHGELESIYLYIYIDHISLWRMVFWGLMMTYAVDLTLMVN